MTSPLTRRLADRYRDVCHLDVESFKPGNVSLTSPGHGMTAAHFIRSAECSAGPLTAGDAGLGERILASVTATRTKVGCNTNLGIILLVAPLVQACLAHSALPLWDGVQAALAATTRRDTEKAYCAIRLAAPGGLGRVETQDVAGAPAVTLLEAMALAADRDVIARQYVNGFADLRHVAMPYLLGAKTRFKSDAVAMTDLFLFLLGRYPDSHIVRKHGDTVALSVSETAGDVHADYLAAQNPDERRAVLRQFDRALKRRLINPGTTADLCVAAFFSHRLLVEAETDAGSVPDYQRTLLLDGWKGPRLSISQSI